MLVVFDFDGVLADPIVSIATVAHRAYCKLYGRIPLKKAINIMKGAKHALRAGMDIMPALLLGLEKPARSITRQELLEFEKSLGKKLDKLEQAYYNAKFEIRKDAKRWVSLFKPHKTALKEFEKACKRYNVFIATTRHANDIMLCFERWHISFDRKRIVDLQISKDKRKQFRHIKALTKIPFKRMIFIEDTLWNALMVKELNVNVLLSTWGLSNKEQHEQAKKLGIRVIKRQRDICKEIEKTERSFATI